MHCTSRIGGRQTCRILGPRCSQTGGKKNGHDIRWNFLVSEINAGRVKEPREPDVTTWFGL